jgi:uncharacterized DUF497 family protein
MRFVWDEVKNRSNKAKHGLSFDLAVRVFGDPLHLSVPDRREYGEERWFTIGLVGSVALVVIHTHVEQNDEETVRIISARKATRRERARYEEGS